MVELKHGKMDEKGGAGPEARVLRPTIYPLEEAIRRSLPIGVEDELKKKLIGETSNYFGSADTGCYRSLSPPIIPGQVSLRVNISEWFDTLEKLLADPRSIRHFVELLDVRVRDEIFENRYGRQGYDWSKLGEKAIKGIVRDLCGVDGNPHLYWTAKPGREKAIRQYFIERILPMFDVKKYVENEEYPEISKTVSYAYLKGMTKDDTHTKCIIGFNYGQIFEIMPEEDGDYPFHLDGGCFLPSYGASVDREIYTLRALRKIIEIISACEDIVKIEFGSTNSALLPTWIGTEGEIKK